MIILSALLFLIGTIFVVYFIYICIRAASFVKKELGFRAAFVFVIGFLLLMCKQSQPILDQSRNPQVIQLSKYSSIVIPSTGK